MFQSRVREHVAVLSLVHSHNASSERLALQILGTWRYVTYARGDQGCRYIWPSLWQIPRKSEASHTFPRIMTFLKPHGASRRGDRAERVAAGLGLPLTPKMVREGGTNTVNASHEALGENEMEDAPRQDRAGRRYSLVGIYLSVSWRWGASRSWGGTRSHGRVKCTCRSD